MRRWSVSPFVIFLAFGVLSVAQKEFSDQSLQTEGAACEFEPGNGRIIRVKESVSLGARFLDSLTTETEYDCLSSCCATVSCDLAVYRRPRLDGKSNCYLFVCGTPTLCVFAPHLAYNTSERLSRGLDLLPTAGTFPLILFSDAVAHFAVSCCDSYKSRDANQPANHNHQRQVYVLCTRNNSAASQNDPNNYHSANYEFIDSTSQIFTPTTPTYSDSYTLINTNINHFTRC